MSVKTPNKVAAHPMVQWGLIGTVGLASLLYVGYQFVKPIDTVQALPSAPAQVETVPSEGTAEVQEVTSTPQPPVIPATETVQSTAEPPSEPQHVVVVEQPTHPPKAQPQKTRALPDPFPAQKTEVQTPAPPLKATESIVVVPDPPTPLPIPVEPAVKLPPVPRITIAPQTPPPPRVQPSKPVVKTLLQELQGKVSLQAVSVGDFAIATFNTQQGPVTAAIGESLTEDLLVTHITENTATVRQGKRTATLTLEETK